MTVGNYRINSVGGMPSAGEDTLQRVVVNSITILLVFAVIFTIFFLIWGGVEWITSGGDKEKLASARKRIVFAIIGFVVILLSFFIINLVGGFLGVGSLN